MIIPIRRAPGNNGAAEFMMIELNGELLRPQSLPVDGGGDNRKRRLEFGSVKFEKDVSQVACSAHSVLSFHPPPCNITLSSEMIVLT
mmetsp:Transcript_8819/g.20544  ORF Transcript_8819/g.20544 Transcript_8819/m.20544 type:complete len:87 (-) Transcript_8819:108-368(-)